LRRVTTDLQAARFLQAIKEFDSDRSSHRRTGVPISGSSLDSAERDQRSSGHWVCHRRFNLPAELNSHGSI
jgi:hypothetical protein